MDGEMYVTQDEVENLRNALYEAANNFNSNFEQLDLALNHLVESGFTGDAATSLLSTYSSKVKPDLDNINEETKKVSSYADNKVDDTTALMNTLDNIANG